MANYAPDLLVELLGAVPSGTTATFTLVGGRIARGEARDYPRPGRRWTVEGWEWFIDAAFLEKVVSVTIDGPIELAVAA